MHNDTSKPIHVISRGVIIKDGKLLLCENKKHQFYYLPGGHIDPNESAAVALEREIQEELAVTCTVGRFLGLFEYKFVPDNPSTKCHNHEYNMLFMIEAPSLVSERAPQSAEEHIAFAWIPLTALHEVDFKPQLLKEPLLAWLDADYTGALVTVIE